MRSSMIIGDGKINGKVQDGRMKVKMTGKKNNGAKKVSRRCCVLVVCLNTASNRGSE
jgi:hypothetical protein